MTKSEIGGGFFDREAPEDYLREWTAQVAAEKKVAEAGTKSVLIFSIGTEWLALPTEVFQEVVDQFAVRTLPHHRDGILGGVVNVRGQLLVCVSLESLLGLVRVSGARPTEKRTSRGLLMVCNRKGDRLAFRVDEVCGVHRYHPGNLRDVPATLARATAGAYTLGVFPWNDRTVGCLDDELLFYTLNKGLA